MRSTFAPLALAALVAANPLPQAVTSSIAPASSPPASCQSSYDGTFQIQIVKMSAKKRQANGDNGALIMTLSDGTLTDDQGRTGYIASNRQFQFDSPPQAGAIYTTGFSVCPNNLLAIGDKTTWYQCLSGDFYNLYDQSQGGQCEKVNIQVVGGGSAPAQTSAPASEMTDGQITGSAVAPVTQISDGQPQATTATPVAPVTQISDGQIQATTATPAAPVTQITDGQIQAPTAPVTQISDGQIQAPTSVVTQISDGQIQAPYPTGMAPTGAMPTGSGVGPYSSVVPATGAAATAGFGSGIIGLAAGVVAVAML